MRIRQQANHHAAQYLADRMKTAKLAQKFALILAISFLIAGAASAQTLTKAPLTKAPSTAVIDAAVLHNENLTTQLLERGSLLGTTTVVRPFADYEEAGYVFVNGDFQFSSREAKEAIAKNLPKDMVLVVFVDDASGSRATALRASYSKLLPPDRLKIIELEDASTGFWARDGLPVPVIDTKTDALALVDARYYYSFEPDQAVSAMFGSSMTSHKFNFEGGNFMANHQGHCIIVNNRMHAKIPDAIFETQYGCKKLQRLPHISGIGHIDEHVRFISEDTVLSDLPEYKKDLEAAGLKVVMLPQPEGELETYVNSLIINGVAIVPVYDEATDQAALDIYTKAGFKAIPADSSSLSNDGQGSIHCITMTYPPTPFKTLLKNLNAKELR